MQSQRFLAAPDFLFKPDNLARPVVELTKNDISELAHGCQAEPLSTEPRDCYFAFEFVLRMVFEVSVGNLQKLQLI